MRVVLVRHGETAWSRAGRHTGRTDLPLLDEGVHQAEAAGVRLRGFTFAQVWCSPLTRARETCTHAGLGREASFDADLMEWDYGDYEGRRTAEIRQERPTWDLFTDGVPGGESFAEVSERVERVIARVADAGGDIAIFAHGHLLRVLAATWLGMGPPVARGLLLSPATISVLGRDREWPVIALWNDAGHLEAG
ncbi:MAG TPA: histidine phosphatase family protein [Acidimicrobiales bacterium]